MSAWMWTPTTTSAKTTSVSGTISMISKVSRCIAYNVLRRSNWYPESTRIAKDGQSSERTPAI